LIIGKAGPRRYNFRINNGPRAMQHVKITAIGNSAGIILPKEVLAQLGVDKGDSLSVVTTPNGIELSAYDPTFDEQMKIARDIMARYRNALRELAK
jgi:putative addiction module antidote